jgi:hypothetical protein
VLESFLHPKCQCCSVLEEVKGTKRCLNKSRALVHKILHAGSQRSTRGFYFLQNIDTTPNSIFLNSRTEMGEEDRLRSNLHMNRKSATILYQNHLQEEADPLQAEH